MIKDLNPENYVNMFAENGTQLGTGVTAPQFGMQEMETDILATPPKEENEPDKSSVTETTTIAPGTEVDSEKEIDILGDETTKGTPGRKPKYDFTDMSGYFQDRLKNGKFVAIEEEMEDGSKKVFVPNNPEEFDEVIDIQVKYQLDKERKALEQSIYQTKTPAWQAVLKYSEMVDDPAEILPFIQGIKTIESVANIDVNEIEGAETVVRIRLEQRGETPDVIEEQIEVLKSADKLISTAQKYKPMIEQEEKKNLTYLVQEQKKKEAEYHTLIDNIRENAVKAIESPIFGKAKLKNEEKAAVYDLIAEPDEQTKGYAIYNAIDSLFEKGDFDTLKQVALLLTKKDSFYNYISSGVADQTAASLQRKLRVAADSRASNSKDFTEEDKPRVSRNQYNSQPRFGR